MNFIICKVIAGDCAWNFSGRGTHPLQSSCTPDSWERVITLGSAIAICGADIPPILAIKEHIPTAEERIVVGNSSAVNMYTRAKLDEAKNLPNIAKTVLEKKC